MCGIGGLLGGAVPSSTIARMLSRLETRGPDDAGWLDWSPGADRPETGTVWDEARAPGPVVLLHTRLSILDLSEAGHQPMASADGRYWIVYNGEVYNHEELRTELEARGHRFVSRSDTEVVLAAYSEWGMACLNRFVGMFAFALLDTLTHRLFLVRDFFGVKPLCYTSGPGGFAFASNIQTLLEVPWVSRRADPARLHRYLTSESGMNGHGGDTMFAAIKQVPAAHWLEVDIETGAIEGPVRYWDPTPAELRDVPYDEAVREVRRRFLESVALHLRSDVPVAAALSGGVDSSAITMAMREALGAEGRIETFSYIAADARLSEEAHIDVVSAAARTRQHKVRPEATDLGPGLTELLRIQGEPVGSPSMYAQYRVFQAVREAGIKVVLDGQGADEILAGYRSHYPARITGLIAARRPFEALRTGRRMAHHPGASFAAISLGALGPFLPAPLRKGLRRRGIVERHLRPAWLHSEWFRRRGCDDEGPPSASRDALRRRLVRSLTETNLPALLRYEDRSSMAWSVESRVPFLTPDLVHYVLSLPEAYLIGPDGTTKRVFRDAMRGIVPDRILDRKDKVSFATTEADWVRSEAAWVSSVLATGRRLGIPFLDMDRVDVMWTEFASGRRPWTRELWRILNLILWVEMYRVTFDDAPLAPSTRRPRLWRAAPSVPVAAPATADPTAA